MPVGANIGSPWRTSGPITVREVTVAGPSGDTHTGERRLRWPHIAPPPERSHQVSYPPTGDPYQSPSGAPGPDPGHGHEPPTAQPYGTYDPYGQQVQAYTPVSGYPGAAYPAGGHQPQYRYGYGYAPQYVVPTNGLAMASLIVSILALVVGVCSLFMGGYLGIIGVVGLILGVVARRQIREQGTRGDGMALAGVIIGSIAVALSIIATVLFVATIATL
jgi:hypothetical protein